MYKHQKIKRYGIQLFVLLVFLSMERQAISQDFHFTQFFANKLYLAPSFAGATQQNRAIMNYRNQWLGLSQGKGYTTYSASVDHAFSNFNSGMGLLAIRDIAGSGKLGTMQLSLAYSYDVLLNDMIHLRPGVSFSYLQRSIDFAALTFGDQLGSSSGTSSSTNHVLPAKDHAGAFDASSSVIVYATDFWVGTTFDHLLSPNLSLMQGEDRFPMRISLYGGYTILRKGRLLKPVDETLSVAFIFKNEKNFRQLDAGIYYAKSPLTFGFWYRGIPIVNSDRGDSFAFLLGFKRQKFSFGYSYDFTISNLISNTSGTHELSMAIEFSKLHRKKMHAVPCPEF